MVIKIILVQFLSLIDYYMLGRLYIIDNVIWKFKLIIFKIISSSRSDVVLVVYNNLIR